MKKKQVAEIIGVSEAEMSRILQNCQMAENEQIKDFKPFLYNLWNSSKDKLVRGVCVNSTI